MSGPVKVSQSPNGAATGKLCVIYSARSTSHRRRFITTSLSQVNLPCLGRSLSLCSLALASRPFVAPFSLLPRIHSWYARIPVPVTRALTPHTQYVLHFSRISERQELCVHIGGKLSETMALYIHCSLPGKSNLGNKLFSFYFRISEATR
ncbi:hypothetical protein T492DRAFT_1048191 [Pavlovales sp. CCMP2436]|nr:hypothetical protein T492DRAFT_1048191 [Pavlovales sp. CCMP2436]